MRTKTTLTLMALLVSALPLCAQSSPEDLIPNSVKYADTGVKPAKGRSGSASIEARALLGRDGVTHIEATTGSFDSTATAPGSIDRLQIKQNYNSEDAVTQNVATSGSFVTVPVTGLSWREAIQLQAKVSGIDPSRADVVTVEEQVKKRPNLALNPNAPTHALAGIPFPASLVIFEFNRDIGARATCVMRVNGEEVDRAEGIWINAGGRVVCHMMHTFETAGPQQVEYALVDQSPADWDPSNNIARTTVRVYSSAQEMTSWDVTTSERDWEYHSKSSSTSDWSQDQSDHYEHVVSHRTQFSGMIAGPFNLQQMQASFYERTDGGQPVYELPTAPFTPMWGWGDEQCRFSDRRYAYMTVCSNGAVTTLSYYRGSADVVYISKYSMQYLRPDGTWSGFSYVISMPRKTNWLARYGNTLSIEFRLSDGTTLWEAAKTMQLEVDGPHHSSAGGCYSGWSNGCWESNETVTYKHGSASHDGN